MANKQQQQKARKDMKSAVAQLNEDMKQFITLDSYATTLQIERHPNMIRIAGVLTTRYNDIMNKASVLLDVLEGEQE